MVEGKRKVETTSSLRIWSQRKGIGDPFLFLSESEPELLKFLHLRWTLPSVARGAEADLLSKSWNCAAKKHEIFCAAHIPVRLGHGHRHVVSFFFFSWSNTVITVPHQLLDQGKIREKRKWRWDGVHNFHFFFLEAKTLPSAATMWWVKLSLGLERKEKRKLKRFPFLPSLNCTPGSLCLCAGVQEMEEEIVCNRW